MKVQFTTKIQMDPVVDAAWLDRFGRTTPTLPVILVAEGRDWEAVGAVLTPSGEIGTTLTGPGPWQTMPAIERDVRVAAANRLVAALKAQGPEAVSSPIDITPEIRAFQAKQAKEAADRQAVIRQRLEAMEALGADGIKKTNGIFHPVSAHHLVGCDISVVPEEMRERVEALVQKVNEAFRTAMVAFFAGMSDDELAQRSWPTGYTMLTEEQQEALKERWKAAVEARKARMAAACREWLGAHGGAMLIAKMDSGYDCAGGIKSLVRRLAVEKIEALGEGLTVLERKDECSECRDRSCPSDAAFAVEMAAKDAGYDAEVVWATWSYEDGDDVHAELVRVFVPCPWDVSEKDYLTLEVRSDAFAD